jgi:hypothetical protein
VSKICRQNSFDLGSIGVTALFVAGAAIRPAKPWRRNRGRNVPRKRKWFHSGAADKS